MKIPTHKDEWFRGNNFPIDDLDMAIAEFDEEAYAADAPRKEVKLMAAKSKVTEETPPVQKADVPPEEEEKEEEEMEKGVTREEVADVVVELIKGHEEALAVLPEILKEMKAINKRLSALEATDEEKLARAKEEVPPASLQTIIAQRLMKEGAPKGNLDKLSSQLAGELEKAKPDETDTSELLRSNAANGVMSIPFLAAQMNGGRKND